MIAQNHGALLERFVQALPADSAAVADVFATVTDWPGFFQHAAREALHDIALQSALDFAAALPDPVRKHAERYRTCEQLVQVRMLESLAEALQAFDEADIRVATLKGPVLAQRIYPADVVRPSTDLDLLVRAQDVYRAAAVLERLRYRGVIGPSERYYREHHHHLHFQRPEGPLIELHFHAYTGFGVTVTAESVFEHARRYRIQGGRETWILAPDDEFVYLAAHAAGHLFLRLGWLYDLKLFLHKYLLSWSTIAERARSLGLLTAVSYAVRRLQALGTDGALTVHPLRASLSGLFLAAAQRGEESVPGHLARILFLASLCDNPRRATGFLQHNLLRGARKLAQRQFPRLVPDEWAG
jgi:hypothetical protein